MEQNWRSLEANPVNVTMPFRIMDFGAPERVSTTCAQHLEILSCLEAGDLEGAKQAMCDNIAEGRKNVQNVIKDALAHSFFQTQKAASA